MLLKWYNRFVYFANGLTCKVISEMHPQAFRNAAHILYYAEKKAKEKQYVLFNVLNN